MEDFKELGQESEFLLKELSEIKNLNTKHVDYRGYAVKHLVDNGYIVGIDLTTDLSQEPGYRIKAITQKGKEYFELKNKRKRNDLIWKFVVPFITTLLGLIAGYFLNRFF